MTNESNLNRKDYLFQLREDSEINNGWRVDKIVKIFKKKTDIVCIIKKIMYRLVTPINKTIYIPENLMAVSCADNQGIL